MTISHILTDEEIDALYNHSTDRAFDLARMVEAAVIAKLSEQAVLPEPAYQRLSDLQSGIDNYYTSNQMREAFAQGAASQLGTEPTASHPREEAKIVRFNKFMKEN